MSDLEFIETKLDGLHKIKVFGIGGCGNNAINKMIESGLTGPVFVAANSDLQDLERSCAEIKLQLGVKSTKGLGCGGKPEVGRLAAEEEIDKIKELLVDSNIVFITAGMGGGTGSGGAPLVAEVLSKLDDPPLIVSVVTTPFEHEKRRKRLAKPALAALTKYSHCIISISNEKLMEIAPKNGEMQDAMDMANEILYQAVSSITELIVKKGQFNVDFADLRSTLEIRGPAIMGCGEARGEDRAMVAVKQAVSSPLMSGLSIKGAKGVLVNITASKITNQEFKDITNYLQGQVDEDADIFTGVIMDDSLTDSGSIKVTVIATGLINYDEKDSENNPIQASSLDLDDMIQKPIPIENEDEPELEKLTPQITAVESRPGTYFGVPQVAAGQKTIRSLLGPSHFVKNVTKYENNLGVDPSYDKSSDLDRPTYLRKNAD